MNEYEAVLVINGYQHRRDDEREILAHFFTHLINSERKPSKQIKPDKLFNRKGKEKQIERQREASSTNVVELEDKRRERMRDVKRDGPPVLGPRQPK